MRMTKLFASAAALGLFSGSADAATIYEMVADANQSLAAHGKN